MELSYKVQHYQWGKKGKKSIVYQLYSGTHTLKKNDEAQHYAELWIGTHVNGPSSIKDTGKTIKQLLEQHPKYLGDEVTLTLGTKADLPFLFKVLSINTALSIQAHPDKELAQILHKRDPQQYRDPNHKPELAIALTPFEALCGFRPLPEIHHFIQNVPELADIIGKGIVSAFVKANNAQTDVLKDALRAVLKSPPKTVANQLKKLIERLKTLDGTGQEKYYTELIERLHTQYPGDVGCFMVYFFNYLVLKPSEALFMGPNIPHAYISGDCVECMACSDNVVRAGFTPKPKDAETLLSMLNYKGGTAKSQLFSPADEDACSKVFRPPVPDFAVAEYKVPSDLQVFHVPVRASASTFIVIEGLAVLNDVSLKPGVALFLPAKVEATIKEIKANLLLYQAFANV